MLNLLPTDCVAEHLRTCLPCMPRGATQEVADWLRQQQAQGRLAAAVLMPQHSCAAGLQFAERALNAHMQVAFPGLGAGGFEEPVMMRGTGFAMLNLLLELAVARCACWGQGGQHTGHDAGGLPCLCIRLFAPA
jgi:hypothetical protein